MQHLDTLTICPPLFLSRSDAEQAPSSSVSSERQPSHNGRLILDCSVLCHNFKCSFQSGHSKSVADNGAAQTTCDARLTRSFYAKPFDRYVASRYVTSRAAVRLESAGARSHLATPAEKNRWGDVYFGRGLIKIQVYGARFRGVTRPSVNRQQCWPFSNDAKRNWADISFYIQKRTTQSHAILERCRTFAVSDRRPTASGSVNSWIGLRRSTEIAILSQIINCDSNNSLRFVNIDSSACFTLTLRR